MTRVGPGAALAAAASAVVVLELATRSNARYGVEAVAAGAALAVAWLQRDRLRPAPILGLAALLPLGILLAHLARGVDGDVDVQQVYPAQGHALLHGTYPRSEYPPAAVLLFALERATGNVHVANGIAMAACHVAVVAAVLELRTPTARFTAAALAVWPLNAFFWEFKFDLLPTALLVVGLLAALRRRWAIAGVLLAAGTAAKWTPALAAALLALWLVATARLRDATRLAVAFVVPLAVLVVPLVAWDRHAVAAAWTRQASRDITPESLWFLPLHAARQASAPAAVYDPAAAPTWANNATVAIQVLVLAALAAALVVRRPPLERAVAAAAVAPPAFLLLNKIFSAQYLVTVTAALAFAAALVLAGRTLVATLVLVALATGFNLLVYPIGRAWEAASVLMFVCAVAAAAAVVGAALRPRTGSVTRRGYPLRS